MMVSILQNRVGLYEKALPDAMSWKKRLMTALKAGYQFVEMSIDETDHRIRQLYWDAGQKKTLVKVVQDSEVKIESMCLSGHRRFSFGSRERSNREKAQDMMKRAIDMSCELGIKTIQIAGYDVYYEESNEVTRKRYVEGLEWAAELAERHCIMLGIENVERPEIDCIKGALKYVELVNSPWLQLYPDFGNSAANGYNVTEDIAAGTGHLVGMHIKDTKPGVHRNVGFGEGIVPFIEAFKMFNRIQYHGPFVIEMWNQDDPDAEKVVRQALTWVQEKMRSA